MLYLPANRSFLGAQVRPWTLKMIESRTVQGTNYEAAPRWCCDRTGNANDRQVNCPWGKGGNTFSPLLADRVRKQMSSTQHRGEQPGSCKTLADRQGSVCHSKTAWKKCTETDKDNVSAPVSRHVDLFDHCFGFRQLYCITREKTALAICLSSTWKALSFPSTSPLISCLLSLQRLCLLVLRQQFPFPSPRLFPLPFFPSRWLGPLIVSGTCPQEL